MKFIALKKYLSEGLLIVFSVLFALFINNLFSQYQTVQKKRVAQESIEKELKRNYAIIKEWQARHMRLRNAISGILENDNDSLKQELKSGRIINLPIIMNDQSLVDELLTSTAWESAKSTGIIGEFDFETTQKLTKVYNLQDVIVNKSLDNFIRYYFDHAHQVDELDVVLTQLQLRLTELVSQENILVEYYAETLESLKE